MITRSVISVFIIFLCAQCSMQAQAILPLPDTLQNGDTSMAYPRVDDNDENTSFSGGTRDTISIRFIPDSVIHRLQRDKDFAYANDSRYWVKEKPVPQSPYLTALIHFLESAFFRIMMYLLFGALILFLLYKVIVSNKLYLFYSVPKKIIKQQENQETGHLPENLDEALKEAIESGDWKAAVRFNYLKAIQAAADKGLIELHIQATNQEYLKQWKDHPAANDFRYLTNAFEQVWYGGANLDREQFRIIENRFGHYFNLLKN